MSRLQEVPRRSLRYFREHAVSSVILIGGIASGATIVVGLNADSPSASQSSKLADEAKLSNSLRELNAMTEGERIILAPSINSQTQEIDAIHADPEFAKAQHAKAEDNRGFRLVSASLAGDALALGVGATVLFCEDRNVSKRRKQKEANRTSQKALRLT